MWAERTIVECLTVGASRDQLALNGTQLFETNQNGGIYFSPDITVSPPWFSLFGINIFLFLAYYVRCVTRQNVE